MLDGKSNGVNGWGGRRNGAGRPKGARNRRSKELLQYASAEDLELPLPRLLRRMNDPSLSEVYRDSLAHAAAPYCHPRLTATPSAKAAFEMTDQEVEDVIRRQEQFEAGELAGQIVRLPVSQRR